MITGNPFTYTANLGLNALTGIVVRNAIILVDYANELRRNGIDIETAALLAGRRRLRPIFLTTMAAALGVTPMILSRSPLWSPMASVIAVGLVVSMLFTLVLVPVLYVVVERRHERRAARRERTTHETEVHVPGPTNVPAGIAAMNPAATTALILLALGLGTLIPTRRAAAQLAPASTSAAATIRLTLDDAVTLAMKQGYVTRLASARLASAEAHERGAAASLLPQLSVAGNHVRSSGRTTIVVPSGALGNESSGAPLPAADRRFDQGAAALTYMQVAKNWVLEKRRKLAAILQRSYAASLLLVLYQDARIKLTGRDNRVHLDAYQDQRPGSRWTVIENSISDMSQICKAAGIRFVIFTRFEDTRFEDRKLLRQRFDSVKTRLGIPVVDLDGKSDPRWRNADPASLRNSRVDSHPTKLGAEVYATLSFEALQRLKILSLNDSDAASISKVD